MEKKLKETTPSDASKITELMRSARHELYVDQLGVYTEHDFLRVYGDKRKEQLLWVGKLSKAAQNTDKYFSKVLTEGDEFFGFAYGWTVNSKNKVILSKLYVKVGYSGRGVGSQLMGDFMAWAGSLPIYILVEKSNKNALTFYEKHGFKSTGSTLTSEGMTSVWLSNTGS
jgi:ribosomal protein S18 acetylase RimI-like enzyme